MQLFKVTRTVTIIHLATLLLLKHTQSNLLDYTPIPFTPTADCYNCVMSSFIYCVNQGNFDPSLITSLNQLPPGVCCADQSCSEDQSEFYTCSDTFLTPIILCPFDPNQCGSDIINLNVGDSVTLQQIPVGTTCAYEVFAPCGIPTISSSAPNYIYQTLIQDLQDNGPLNGECQPVYFTLIVQSVGISTPPTSSSSSVSASSSSTQSSSSSSSTGVSSSSSSQSNTTTPTSSSSSNPATSSSQISPTSSSSSTPSNTSSSSSSTPSNTSSSSSSTPSSTSSSSSSTPSNTSSSSSRPQNNTQSSSSSSSQPNTTGSSSSCNQPTSSSSKQSSSSSSKKPTSSSSSKKKGKGKGKGNGNEDEDEDEKDKGKSGKKRRLLNQNNQQSGVESSSNFDKQNSRERIAIEKTQNQILEKTSLKSKFQFHRNVEKLVSEMNSPSILFLR